VDDITVMSACELLDVCRNKKLVVAHGVAKKIVEGDSITGHNPGIEYYARVFVDRVLDGWVDLELEVPGPNGEVFLQDVVHTWIFCSKAHLRITQKPPSPPVDSPTSPAAMPDRDNQLPHSPAAKAERSMSPIDAGDRSESPPSPPPAHVKARASDKLLLLCLQRRRRNEMIFPSH
jgi:phosphatidylserine/phosphatidylglycerophosphate/cardiolipin synthase-like enzyme